ncbi:hypothetical protein LCGC14_0476400 [marine sediment metagenome]|uniref:Uncharacterized protein n=1 Tax=marine sediment metagenome TaxID=412755 RepID=A0A0F9STJ0_9ZZZZ
MQSNAVLIGREFERQVYDFLKKRFSKVVWLSHDTSLSPYDFKCINIKGEEFFIEAKFVGNNVKPSLEDNQKNADFVITNKEDEIILIPNKDFKDKVYIRPQIKILRLNPELLEILDRNKRNTESREKCLWRLFFENGWLLPTDRMYQQYAFQVLRDQKPLTPKQQKTMDYFKKQISKEDINKLPSEYVEKLNQGKVKK